MSYLENVDISVIVGATMTSVVQNGQETIDFKSTDGKWWQMYYEPDCCASCQIEDVVGDLSDLVGCPIVMAECITNQENPKASDEESFTWTFYKLATAKGYVTIRWYGCSNGYYSETASFREVGA